MSTPLTRPPFANSVLNAPESGSQPIVEIPPIVFEPAPFDEGDDDTPGADSTGGQITVERTIDRNPDWRFRVSLAPESNYLYNSDDPGILSPLLATKGVIFPYNPTISTSYQANYSNMDITHTNYKFHQYTNSSIEAISVTGRFTAQDEKEAQYLLAAIHFFRSMTKMFYGQDDDPIRGTPPPICYLNGYGSYQFSNHTALVNSFTYTLPTDVDYIPVRPPTSGDTGEIARGNPTESKTRRGSGIGPGGTNPGPKFSFLRGNKNELTWVPTKVDLVLQFLPVVSRNDVSNNFSVRGYANGSIYNGRNTGKGFW